MAWDKDGFCSVCQKQLGVDCQCQGVGAERKRRRRMTGKSGDNGPRTVPNEPSDMGPHPADRRPDTPQPDRAQSRRVYEEPVGHI